MSSFSFQFYHFLFFQLSSKILCTPFHTKTILILEFLCLPSKLKFFFPLLLPNSIFSLIGYQTSGHLRWWNSICRAVLDCRELVNLGQNIDPFAVVPTLDGNIVEFVWLQRFCLLVCLLSLSRKQLFPSLRDVYLFRVNPWFWWPLQEKIQFFSVHWWGIDIGLEWLEEAMILPGSNPFGCANNQYRLILSQNCWKLSLYQS